MSEPIYTFKKGEGWVIQTRQIITPRSGKSYYFEARPPKQGEHFCYAGANDAEFYTNGLPDIDKWSKWASKGSYTIDSFGCRIADLYYGPERYVTVVPCEP